MKITLQQNQLQNKDKKRKRKKQRKMPMTNTHEENIKVFAEIFDNIKHKIKDGEYKVLMETLGEIKKQVEKPIYVHFLSVTAKAKVVSATEDSDGDTTFRHEEVTSKQPEGITYESHDDPISTLWVKSEVETQPRVRLVIDDDDPRQNLEGVRACAFIPRTVYKKMKKNGFHVGNANEVLVYIEDL